MSDDERLSALLSDAVADIEPADRLDDIRRRTQVVDLASRRRRRILATGGTVLATAAVVTAVALLGTPGTPTADPGPAVSPSAPADPTTGTDPDTDSSTTPSIGPSPGIDPSTDPSPSPRVPAPGPSGTRAGAVYYLGAGPRGPRLFREFQAFAGDTDLATATVGAAVAGKPRDPDYTSPWFELGAPTVTVTRENDVVVVDLATDTPIRERPTGLSEAEAALAVEQIVYTAQAAVQERAPVQLRVNGGPTDQVLGVPTSEPLAEGSPTTVLSLMSISSPDEGQTVSGSFVASGVNNAFEATYQWELRSGGPDGAVVLDGFGTATGCCEDRLFAWETEPIDVSGLDPGTYTFIASNSDPSAGEGGGPDTDTRTVVVE